jgi:hypothetical protein
VRSRCTIQETFEVEVREAVVCPIADQRREGPDRAGIVVFEFGKRGGSEASM